MSDGGEDGGGADGGDGGGGGEGALTQILPPVTTAASFVPSAELVMHCHFFLVPAEVSSLHVTPSHAQMLDEPGDDGGA